MKSLRTVRVSMLLIGSVAMSASLTAQTGAEKYAYNLKVVGDDALDRICVGDFVNFGVVAERQVADGSEQIPGMTIKGSVLNPRFGKLKPATAKTAASSTPAGSASFNFTAVAAGTTQLRFSGPPPAATSVKGTRIYPSVSRTINVINCGSPTQGGGGGGSNRPGLPSSRDDGRKTKAPAFSSIKVKSVSTWNVGMTIMATIDDAMLSANAQGGFSGTSDVKWQTSVIGGPGCGAAETSNGPSKADLSAEVDTDNQLLVKITYQPKDFAGFATCGGKTIATSNLATPGELALTVPIGGGVSTQAHPVSAKNGTFVGSATVTVTPRRE